MIKAVIIDDEKKARETVKVALEVYCKDVEIIGEADSVKSGMEILNNLHPDLVLLDIKMQDGSGFDLLKHFPEPYFIPIFITAYNHFAIKAFKFSALDYIVKPIDPDELVQAVEKAKKIKEKQDIVAKINALNENISDKLTGPKKVVLKTEHNIHVVDVSDIVNCESDGSYTTVFMKNGENVIVSKLLKDFEELLRNNHFFRIHQSHLINLNHLLLFEKHSCYVLMSNNKKLPVSTRKKNLLIDLFNDF